MSAGWLNPLRGLSTCSVALRPPDSTRVDAVELGIMELSKLDPALRLFVFGAVRYLNFDTDICSELCEFSLL